MVEARRRMSESIAGVCLRVYRYSPWVNWFAFCFSVFPVSAIATLSLHWPRQDTANDEWLRIKLLISTAVVHGRQLGSIWRILAMSRQQCTPLWCRLQGTMYSPKSTWTPPWPCHWPCEYMQRCGAKRPLVHDDSDIQQGFESCNLHARCSGSEIALIGKAWPVRMDADAEDSGPILVNCGVIWNY